jgi:hypothetical protein
MIASVWGASSKAEGETAHPERQRPLPASSHVIPGACPPTGCPNGGTIVRPSGRRGELPPREALGSGKDFVGQPEAEGMGPLGFEPRTYGL